MHAELADGLKAVVALDMPEAAIAVGIAFLFGALHALMPGHGKAMLIAYHTGTPGPLRHGLANSALLIATHVGSAMVLVAAGIALIEPQSFGRGGNAQKFSTASSFLVTGVGLWLLYVALRGHAHPHAARPGGRTLAFVTGLVPCPLTTFLMTYAALQGAIGAGLLLSGAMALGMITTVAAFALMAIGARNFAMPWLVRTERARLWIGKGLEITGAGAIVLLGVATYLNAL